MVSFDNTENAFKAKTNSELKRSYWLFKLISNPALVKLGANFGPMALNIGFNCLIVQRGTGQVTLSVSGSTINNRYNFTKTAGQHAIMSLVSVASGVFVSSGDMSN